VINPLSVRPNPICNQEWPTTVAAFSLPLRCCRLAIALLRYLSCTRLPSDAFTLSCLAAEGPQRRLAVAMEDTEGTNNASTTTSSTSTSPLFSFSKPGASFGFGFDAAPTPSHPPPPVEVLLSEELFLPSFSFVFFCDSIKGLIFASLRCRSRRSLLLHGRPKVRLQMSFALLAFVFVEMPLAMFIAQQEL
jgi:hypothetical protein